ncbi:BNR repeat-like domain-containing protein [Chitinophaga sp. YR573]|uniref:sialidase family protein n=1 Tax=Chitinophaga sp. YR573 TaxID=1881040 RepID=UPI0008B6F538|nr:sialidase family protein [Chitinophaga sp. YR573]SEV89011.1 BNR repeat-like domain-containing protein [Chitinophaga sp. YR573]
MRIAKILSTLLLFSTLCYGQLPSRIRNGYSFPDTVKFSMLTNATDKFLSTNPQGIAGLVRNPVYSFTTEGAAVIDSANNTDNLRNDGAAIVKLNDGSYLVAYNHYAGSSSDASAATIWLANSNDGGDTWFNNRLLFDTIPGGGSTGNKNLMPAFYRQNNGNIILIFSKNIFPVTKSWLYKSISTDDGLTWSAPSLIHSDSSYKPIAFDRIIKTNTGRLLLPYPVLVAGNGPSTSSIYWGKFFKSDDDGVTWDTITNATVDNGPWNVTEPGVYQLADNSITCYFRTTRGYIYSVKSTDDGNTWTTVPANTGIESQNALSTIRYFPGLKMLIGAGTDVDYGNPTSTTARRVIQLFASSDDGKNWGKILKVDQAESGNLVNEPTVFVDSAKNKMIIAYSITYPTSSNYNLVTKNMQLPFVYKQTDYFSNVITGRKKITTTDTRLLEIFNKDVPDTAGTWSLQNYLNSTSSFSPLNVIVTNNPAFGYMTRIQRYVGGGIAHWYMQFGDTIYKKAVGAPLLRIDNSYNNAYKLYEDGIVIPRDSSFGTGEAGKLRYNSSYGVAEINDGNQYAKLTENIILDLDSTRLSSGGTIYNDSLLYNRSLIIWSDEHGRFLKNSEFTLLPGGGFTLSVHLSNTGRLIVQSFIPIVKKEYKYTLDSIAGYTAVYSFRRLLARYNGPVVRVRNGTTGVVRDIYFNGDRLDTIRLKLFLGTATGFVEKWYDQSGNGLDWSQTTLTAQPTLHVDANGRYDMYFPTTVAKATILSSQGNFNYLHNSVGSASIVSKIGSATTTSLDGLFGNNQGTSGTIGIYARYDNRSASSNTNAITVQVQRGVTSSFTSSSTIQNAVTVGSTFMLTVGFDNTNATPANRLSIYINNAAVVNNNVLTNGVSASNAALPMQIAAYGGNAGGATDCYFSELVFFNKNLSVGEVGQLKINQNNYFNIY